MLITKKEMNDIESILTEANRRFYELKSEIKHLKSQIDACKYTLELKRFDDKYSYLKGKEKEIKLREFIEENDITLPIVYEWYCKETDTYYIGSTKDPEGRYSSHINSKDNDQFHTDLRKYGVNSFTYKILEYCKNRELAYEREYIYINNYRQQGLKLYNKDF